MDKRKELTQSTPLSKSEAMSRIRTRGTGMELLLRAALTAEGVRYRVNLRTLPGTPDVYVPRLTLAIFVNGCFWHGHPCPKGRRPTTNALFWESKISATVARDKIVAG